MIKKKSYDRKFFLKITALFITVFSIGFIIPLIDRFRINSANTKIIELPYDLPEGISFTGDIIVFKKESSIKIFSSRCTHLGCKIKNRDAAGNLVCSCHGSVFSADGKVLSGPTRSDLNELKWRIDAKSGKIIIENVPV